MKSIRPFQYHWLSWVSYTACLALTGCVALSAYAAPAPNSASDADKETLRYKSPPASLKDFSDTGAPRSRGSAGSRGSCPVATPEASLPVSLVPLKAGSLSGNAIEVPFGQTVSSHPTFWFQFSQNSDVIESLELILVDQETQTLVQEIRNIPKLESTSLPGIFGVQWPLTEPALESNRLYRWFLVIECRNPQGTGLFLSGLIQRQELSSSINRQLKTATARERAFLYANNGIWYEAITELHKALQITPNSVILKSDWASLLDSVGL